jgi:hypothetical protein
MWACYGLARVWLVPTDGAVTESFDHDSGYICIVAQEVRAGNGYINPAHWRLFLNPPRLPMPYHNENPGYPTVIAGLSKSTKKDVVYAGLLVSALSSWLLVAAVFFLVKRYAGGLWFPALVSGVVAFFPVLWHESLVILPDALCTALIISMIAAAVWAKESWHWFIVGVLFGCAWLVRSTAMLVVPPLLWWLLRKMPLNRAATAIAMFTGSAVITASPWPWYKYKVWGSPLRSDMTYAWLQNYYARSYGGDVSKFWRSLTPPPSLGTILRDDPAGFARHLLYSIPVLLYMTAAEITEWHKLAAPLLLLLVVMATWLSLNLCRTAEFQVGFLFLAISIVSLLPRAESFQIRYIAPSLVLFVIWIVLPLMDSSRSERGHHWFAQSRAQFIRFFGLYLVLVMIPQDIRDWHTSADISAERFAYRQMVRQVAAGVGQDEAVITELPYFFTLFTGRRAVNVPSQGKEALMKVMSRYLARLVLLPTSKLNYYYPNCVGTLSPEIRVKGRIGAYTLFERVSVPSAVYKSRLAQRLETKDQQIAAQQHEIDALKQQNASINALSQRLAALEQQVRAATPQSLRSLASK